ncbi:hypothetical protein BH09BAC1_BH09BAC1_15080 [soil metagenome]
MDGELYIILIKLDGKVEFTLWGERQLGDEEIGVDRFALDNAGKLLLHDSFDRSRLYALENQLKLKEFDEDVDYFKDLDFDKVVAWIRKPNTRIECELFNNIWNAAGDLAATLPTGFQKHDNNKRTLRIYDKLFWGLNLPAFTPPGRHYIPRWNKWEVLLLRTVMRDAVRSFQQAIKDSNIK